MNVVGQMFNEDRYLDAHPDVAAAVQSKAIGSGAEHYERFGRTERRALSRRDRPAPLDLPFGDDTLPTRRDKILANLKIRQLEGLEIGALASPQVWPEEGNITFVDHVDTETLRNKYQSDLSVDKSNVVTVNAVWGEQTLQECIGLKNKVDYVVASHVIEHVPDLVTWLEEIKTILRENGTLRLAIPDRRYTFDYCRFESKLHDVVDAWLRKARAPLPRVVMEHYSLVKIVDCSAAWRGELGTNLVSYHSLMEAMALARGALTTGTYHDSHCWVFTPISFAELCMEMAELDLLGFACAHYFETERNELEFIVHAAPCENKAAIIASWAHMRASLLKSPTYQKSPSDMLAAARLALKEV